ncbi:TPA: hypothetical protein JRX32_000402 [Elizabethkingia anophelis]|uniref:hypothetical protein n=1 Tax=Elizabethkingia anophelis TaxID=1117645 RepID=UPI00162542B5|nr:hypothetical protein [Elizabethkingia anophelis]MCT3982349.1 hypothetical protein [Elizabethkingia anophelis]MCT4321543.1 hypothetical protein [Elizabethkingia anophelis]HAY3533816.1 hypothetical protein [Elizabethkingia anophelis]HAY3545932.1 hypothetical protein [Elizabethkingia anophelis]HAY3590759.1 hypothetical protein [Elizabethkingia anophelis]
MTKEQISEYLKSLKEIAYHKQLPNFVTNSAKNYDYRWILNNNSSYRCDKTIPIDTIEDAIEIIHMFSNDPKEFIRLSLESQTYSKEPPLYLHFTKEARIPE